MFVGFFNKLLWSSILDLSCENKSSSGIIWELWKPLFCSIVIRLGNVFILLRKRYLCIEQCIFCSSQETC